MTEQIWGTDNKPWTSIKHGMGFWDKTDLMIWINENIEGDYRLNTKYIFFEREADATMFMLKYK